MDPWKEKFTSPWEILLATDRNEDCKEPFLIDIRIVPKRLDGKKCTKHNYKFGIPRT